MSTYWLVLVSTAITLVAPLLLARMDADSSYWVAAFPAMCLIPLSADGGYHPSNKLHELTFKISVIHGLEPYYIRLIPRKYPGVGGRGIQRYRPGMRDYLPRPPPAGVIIRYVSLAHPLPLLGGKFCRLRHDFNHCIYSQCL